MAIVVGPCLVCIVVPNMSVSKSSMSLVFKSFLIAKAVPLWCSFDLFE